LLAGFFLAVFLNPIEAASPFDPVPYETLPSDVKIETVVANATQVVAMDFTPDGRLLYTERTGKVRVVVNGVLQNTAVMTFPVQTDGERGLLGLAVDPNFAANHFVWVYFTKQTSGQCSSPSENRVVRFSLGANNQGFGETVAGCFPVDQWTAIHNGGNLHFGPDGKLYVTVGNNDMENDGVDPAQNLGSPLGKIHRYNPTVPLTSPSDNPFYNTPGAIKSLYARGLRNSFDFAFDPIGGGLFATENGDACDDEINRIVSGGNYGWRPNNPCEDQWPTGPDPAYNTLPPLIFWTPSLAPTGITFYTGATIPEWQGDLFMCGYKDATTAIHHFKLNAARTALVSHTILTNTTTHQRLQCRTDLLPGPDGALYFSEGGGWLNGSIKRLIRRSSFASTTVNPQRANPAAGSALDYTIDLRHIGSATNTFGLTVAVLPTQASLVQVDTAHGSVTPGPFNFTWSGTVSGTETWTATYRVQIGSLPTTAYPLTHSVRLSAPGLATLVLTPTVIVNGQAVFLPSVLR
jgi:glucose/arabinose dehydrogenase